MDANEITHELLYALRQIAFASERTEHPAATDALCRAQQAIDAALDAMRPATTSEGP